MGKLIYKTKKPKPPAIAWEGFSTHNIEPFEKLPDNERAGLDLVNKVMLEILPKFEEAGYDTTRVYFSIGFDAQYKKR